MKNKLMQFMQGRYGFDKLNDSLNILTIILIIIQIFKPSVILTTIITLLLVFNIFRSLSKNISARSNENEIYLRMTRPIRATLKITKLNLMDPNNKYVRCPNCHAINRLPKKKGKVEIKCPVCKDKFEAKS
ncbi:MAG: hypothetical protein WBO70_01575 [Erysipelotrichaceae bacterium]